MKKISALILAIAFFSPLANSHEGHVHEAALEAAPRGGILRDADPFKAEAILKDDTVRIYVYDKELKQLELDEEEVKGEVQFPRKEAQPVTFKKEGDYYEATIEGISTVHRYDLHIDLVVGGEKALADFGIDNIR